MKNSTGGSKGAEKTKKDKEIGWICVRCSDFITFYRVGKDYRFGV